MGLQVTSCVTHPTRSRKEVVKEEGTLPSKTGISPLKLPDQTPRMARTRQTLKELGNNSSAPNQLHPRTLRAPLGDTTNFPEDKWDSSAQERGASDESLRPRKCRRVNDTPRTISMAEASSNATHIPAANVEVPATVARKPLESKRRVCAASLSSDTGCADVEDGSGKDSLALEHVFETLSSVPMHVDATFIAATRALEDGRLPTIDGITTGMVLAENGNFNRYRIRLLHSMLRRAWFSALTDFNMRQLFPPGPDKGGPQEFVRLIRAINQAIRTELLALKAPTSNGGASVSMLLRRGMIRFCLKGGNSIFLLAQSALSKLPDNAMRDELQTLFNKNVKLSDVDFMLTICPDAEDFAEVHMQCCRSVRVVEGEKPPESGWAPRTMFHLSTMQNQLITFILQAVRRALTIVRDWLCADLEKKRPECPNFVNFRAAVSQDPEVQQTLAAIMDTSTENVRKQLVEAWEADDNPGAEPEPPHQHKRKRCEDKQDETNRVTHPELSASLAPLIAELHELEFAGNAANIIEQTQRRDLDIWTSEDRFDCPVSSPSPTDPAAAASRRVHCRGSGTSNWLYISDNTSCDFSDARGRCKFALIRLLVGYRTTHPQVQKFHHIHRLDPMQPLLKGELIDVSIPFHEDQSLRSVWNDVDVFVNRGKLCTTYPRMVVSLDVESIDALLREQSDLTFGPRMQMMEIWQVRKVEKRLPRLIILAGIKSMMLPYPTEAVVECWARLVESLHKFLSLSRKLEADQLAMLSEWNLSASMQQSKTPARTPASRGVMTTTPCGQGGDRRKSVRECKTVQSKVVATPASGRRAAKVVRSVPNHGGRSVLEDLILEECGLKSALLSKLTHKLLKDSHDQSDIHEVRGAEYYGKWAQVVQLLIQPAEIIRDTLKAAGQTPSWSPIDKASLFTFHVPNLWHTDGCQPKDDCLNLVVTQMKHTSM